MDNKYSKFTLPQLTTEYFEFERKINNLNIEKSKLDEQINNLYDDRCSVYNLIKEKQIEEEEIKKQNYIKYGMKVKLEDNDQLNRNYGMTLSDLKNAK